MAGVQQVIKVLGPVLKQVALYGAGDGIDYPPGKRGSTMKFVPFVHGFVQDEDGAAAIEYGLIAALIAVAIIVGAGLLGTNLNGIFTRLAACMATPDFATCSAVV